MNLTPIPADLEDEQLILFWRRMRYELAEIERLEYLRLAHEKMAAVAGCDPIHRAWELNADGLFVCQKCGAAADGDTHASATAEAETEARYWFRENHQEEVVAYAELRARLDAYAARRATSGDPIPAVLIAEE